MLPTAPWDRFWAVPAPGRGMEVDAAEPQRLCPRLAVGRLQLAIYLVALRNKDGCSFADLVSELVFGRVLSVYKR